MSISFIIPYYKIDKALLMRCIDSIRTLDTDTFDWEIRIIDDETPESNAKGWIEAINDPRIHYTHITHQGLGGARNQGIEESTKEYLMMVDSDDYLFTSQLKQALHIVETEQPDALTFQYKKVYGADTENTSAPPHNIIAYKGNALEYMVHNDIPPSSCRYIIRKSAIHNLRFTPNLLHEDEEFSTLLFLHINTLIVTNLHVYAYYQRPNSIINNITPSFILQRFSDLRHILKTLDNQKDKFHSSDIRHKAFKRRCDTLSLCIIVNLINSQLNWNQIKDELQKLKAMNRYPLRKENYGIRYTLVRLATCTTWSVKLLHKIKKCT